MRYLAIDFGNKRTGLALCDRAETICSPLMVLATSGALARQIAVVVEEEGVEAIVIGLPLNMDGTEGPQAKRTREFAGELRGRVRTPILFHDERLSSFDAEGRLAGLDLTRKQKKKHLDAVAAASILESFLELKNDEYPEGASAEPEENGSANGG